MSPAWFNLALRLPTYRPTNSIPSPHAQVNNQTSSTLANEEFQLHVLFHEHALELVDFANVVRMGYLAVVQLGLEVSQD